MSTIKLFICLLIAGFAVIMLTPSCEKYTFKEEGISVDTITIISFSQDIVPVFKNCTSCHNGAQNPNLKDNPYNSLVPNYVSVADTSNPTASTFYHWITTDDAHIPRTTTPQKSLIWNWIKQGVKNN